VKAQGVRRLGWGFADQALSSLTNFVFSLLVARTLAERGLGAFALIFGSYTFLLGLGRSLTSEPLVVRHSASSPIAWSAAVRAAGGAAIVTGMLGGIACLGLGLTLGGELGAGFIALAVTLPGLLLQDAWRFSMVAGSRARSAFVNDLIWAIALIPLVGVVLLSGRASTFWLTLAWGGAGTVAAVAGSLQSRAMPRAREARAWILRNWELWRCFGSESLISSGTQLTIVYAIGWLAGLTGMGVIQAAGLLLGPVNVLLLATGLVALPELVRLAGRSRRLVRLASCAVTLLLAASVLITGAVLLALPDAIGNALLDATWEPAREVLVPLIVMAAGTAVTTGSQLGLRAVAAARRSLLANSLSSVILVISTAIGASVDGAVGAAWGLAVGRWLGSCVWWINLVGAVRKGPKDQPAPRATDESEVVPPVSVHR
jgi:O-antigen/teichoic acid export membrane protein